MPPTQRPLRLEAAILSRMRSDVTSRSNWANDSSTFNVNLPMDLVVLNCWVTDTKDTACLGMHSIAYRLFLLKTSLRGRNRGGFRPNERLESPSLLECEVLRSDSRL